MFHPCETSTFSFLKNSKSFINLLLPIFRATNLKIRNVSLKHSIFKWQNFRISRTSIHKLLKLFLRINVPLNVTIALQLIILLFGSEIIFLFIIKLVSFYLHILTFLKSFCYSLNIFNFISC